MQDYSSLTTAAKKKAQEDLKAMENERMRLEGIIKLAEFIEGVRPNPKTSSKYKPREGERVFKIGEKGKFYEETILAVLKANTEANADIFMNRLKQEKVHINRQTLYTILSDMKSAGKIERGNMGWYKLPETPLF